METKEQKELLKWAKERGFDLSHPTSDGKVEISCSKCQAMVVDGIPMHNIECPNQVRRLDS